MDDEVSFKLSIPTDNEGYVTFECPFCNDKFKLEVTEVKRDDVINLYCPYCGLLEEVNTFFPKKVIEQAKIIASNYVKEILNDYMGNLEKIFKNDKIISIKTQKINLENEKELFEITDNFESIEFNCCNSKAKVNVIEKLGTYCPYCGVW